MTRYERRFETDWDDLDPAAAVERAYAIGVAERLGEDNREHLDAIHAAMATGYERSLIELAYEEGRQEAIDVQEARDSGDEVWSALVGDPPAFVEAMDDDSPAGGRDAFPEALEASEILDRFDVDSTAVVDRPDFLDR